VPDPAIGRICEFHLTRIESDAPGGYPRQLRQKTAPLTWSMIAGESANGAWVLHQRRTSLNPSAQQLQAIAYAQTGYQARGHKSTFRDC